jgi:hypothetical protein
LLSGQTQKTDVFVFENQQLARASAATDICLSGCFATNKTLGGAVRNATWRFAVACTCKK